MSTTDSTPTDASLADLAHLVEDLQERVADLEAERDDLAAENQRLQERVDDLESELRETRETAARERAELCGRVYDLEEAETQPDSAGSNPTPDAGESGSRALYRPESPLEQVVAIPEHVAENELRANQRRARFVAKDLPDYTTKTPNGRVISSPDLRKVLRAGDMNAHTQTLQRVRELLDDLGGDEVEIVERRGIKRIVFDEELVARLQRLQQADHACVMPAEA